MGKNGDQDINWVQNATLAACGQNDVDIHLFEVIDAGEYIYCGRTELVDKPYIDVQPGEDGIKRNVWMFPIRPVPDNNVKKPDMFVFKDMDDYKARGKNVDFEYMKLLVEQRKNDRKSQKSGVVGRQVKHNAYGAGTVISAADNIIVVSFSSVGTKNLNLEICMKNNIIEFI